MIVPYSLITTTELEAEGVFQNWLKDVSLSEI